MFYDNIKGAVFKCSTSTQSVWSEVTRIILKKLYNTKVRTVPLSVTSLIG